MPSSIFYIIISLSALLPIWFVMMIWSDRVRNGWNWISRDTRDMYIDFLEVAAGVSVIAAALVAAIVSTQDTRPRSVMVSIRVSVTCLLVCVVFAFAGMVGLSRGCDRARSRFALAAEIAPRIDREQGQLNDVEFGCVLFFGCVCAIGFLVGLVFLGRVTFQV